jgi:hypothetical protein
MVDGSGNRDVVEIEDNQYAENRGLSSRDEKSVWLMLPPTVEKISKWGKKANGELSGLGRAVKEVWKE